MATPKRLIIDCGDYYRIDGFNPEGSKVNCCPFCDSKTSSGSWTPDTCPNPKCRAVFFFNAWAKDKVE